MRKKPQDYPSHSRRLLGKHLDEKLLQGPESEKEKEIFVYVKWYEAIVRDITLFLT